MKQPNSISTGEITPDLARELQAALASVAVDPELLAWHQSLMTTPNSFGGNPMFQSGNVPTHNGLVYRQVQTLAPIYDLAKTGIVRNGATSSGKESPRWGHRVFWHSGKEGTALRLWGDGAVIVAPENAAKEGWVTAPDVSAVYAQLGGEVVSILGLET